VGIDKSLQANGLVRILIVEPQPVATEQGLPRLSDLARRRFTVPSDPDSPHDGRYGQEGRK
jgi:hypothetical protein